MIDGGLDQGRDDRVKSIWVQIILQSGANTIYYGLNEVWKRGVKDDSQVCGLNSRKMLLIDEMGNAVGREVVGTGKVCSSVARHSSSEVE